MLDIVLGSDGLSDAISSRMLIGTESHMEIVYLNVRV